MSDNIKQSQKAYYNLIKRYESNILSDNVSTEQILLLLDEVQCFWMDRLDILDFELDELTKENDCFVLSGAVYLDVKNNEHYLFKSVGDYHLLYDPLLKLESVFRSQIQIDDNSIVESFKRSYRDAIDVLSVYDNDFYILPLQEISARYSKEQLIDYLMNFNLKFISSVFNKDYKSFEQFYKEFKSYKSLEERIIPHFKEKLIFVEHNDVNLLLEKRCENYIKKQGLKGESKHMADAEKFVMALNSRVSQIADIIKTSAILNTIPFIRCPITFQYFLIFMHSFSKNNNDLKLIIEKAIIANLSYRIFNQDIIERNNFDDYCDILNKNNILNNIITEIRKNKIDIFRDNPNKVKTIIEKEFSILN